MCSCVHVPSVNHSLRTTFKTNQKNTTWLYTKTSERNALIDVYLHSIQIKLAHYCTQWPAEELIALMYLLCIQVVCIGEMVLSHHILLPPLPLFPSLPPSHQHGWQGTGVTRCSNIHGVSRGRLSLHLAVSK